MWDRQTESWWQQFTGEGLVGEYAGEQLTFLPSQVIAWGDFKSRFPAGEVLAKPNANRPYGVNPYVGYDSSADPFLFRGGPDPRLAATERVAGLTTERSAKAWPFALLAERGVVEDTFDGRAIVLFHKAGAASALDRFGRAGMWARSPSLSRQWRGNGSPLHRMSAAHSPTPKPNPPGTFWAKPSPGR